MANVLRHDLNASSSYIVASHPSGNYTAQGVNSAPSFRAPAHKHAHHLHLIPPREKSTRTLIIDHMLWVHSRTRFSQARAELGMTDRTGGPSSAHYVHRSRPENYDSDSDALSEGEPPSSLLARINSHGDDEDELLTRQDLTLARSLRLRAEGLEKVITSMLEQPPAHHPLVGDEDDTLGGDPMMVSPPESPRLDPAHPHTLPNSVRLRLALGTVVNDLFARQAPHPPYRHTHQHGSTGRTPPACVQSPASTSNVGDLPTSLVPLAAVSGAFYRNPPHPLHPNWHAQQLRYPKPTPPTPSTRTVNFYTTGADPTTANSPPAFRCPRHLHTGCEICVAAKSPPRVIGQRGRAASFGFGGSAGNYVPPLSSSYARAGPTMSSPSMSNNFGYNANQNTANPQTWRPNGGISGWKDGSGVGAGLLKPGVRGSALRRKIVVGEEDEDEQTGGFAQTPTPSLGSTGAGGSNSGGPGKTGAGNTKLSKLIPRFLRLSALVATELGREVSGEEDVGGDDVNKTQGQMHGHFNSDQGDVSLPAGNNDINTGWDHSRSYSQADLRGSSSNVQGVSPNHGRTFSPVNSRQQQSSSLDSSFYPPFFSQMPSTQGQQTQSRRSSLSSSSQHQGQHPANLSPRGTRSARAASISSQPNLSRNKASMPLLPSREWYCLLAGLLTRAVLEGYLTAGWTGAQAVRCLLLVGLGVESDTGRWGDADLDMNEDEFAEFDPDELPSLVDAVRTLFPSLRYPQVESDGLAGTELTQFDLEWEAEVEFKAEMFERLRRFYDIPSLTPDLSTHMEDLAWQYPAEPVERAAVRFCEAIANWRGKPELETYKNKHISSPGSTAMTIESLVHSNPTSPVLNNATSGTRRQPLRKPSIDVYFQPRESPYREGEAPSRIYLASEQPPMSADSTASMHYDDSGAGYRDISAEAAAAVYHHAATYGDSDHSAWGNNKRARGMDERGGSAKRVHRE